MFKCGVLNMNGLVQTLVDMNFLQKNFWCKLTPYLVFLIVDIFFEGKLYILNLNYNC